MEPEFDDPDLDRLEVEQAYDNGRGPEVVRGFRKVMQAIRAAVDERDLHALRGLRFEKLKGDRSHQYSLRINKQWRLIIEIRGEAPKKRIAVVAIEDYH